MSSATGVKSPNADAYVWIGPLPYGHYASASNWKDATTGRTPASYFPGPLTPVTIAGPAVQTFELITGGGSAASMDLTGNIRVEGSYTIGGVLNVGSPAFPQTPGALIQTYKSTITAGSINVFVDTQVNSLSTPGDLLVNSRNLSVFNGTVRVGGALTNKGGGIDVSNGTMIVGGPITEAGNITSVRTAISVRGASAKLITSGTLTATSGSDYSSARGSVIASDGGFVQLGGAVFNPTANWINPFLGLAVDAKSAIEIGNVGNVALGAITVDVGKAITVNADTSFSGKLVNNGTITVAGGTLTQNRDLSGSGTVQIGKNAAFVLEGTAASTDAITFLGSGATLSIGSPSRLDLGLTVYSTPYRIDATLTGFKIGDSLLLKVPVTTATYAAGAGGRPGTLTLSNGATTVETLRLAGDFAGKSFIVSPTGSNGSSISLANQTQADPLFDSAYYLAHNPDVAAAGAIPYEHYLNNGWKEGRNPSALFDTNYYLQQNPDVKAAKANPLLHFGQHGWKEGRDPSLLFSDAKYLAANPDVRTAGVDPLLHYLSHGQSEGRMAFLSGGTAVTDPLVNPDFYDRQLGATLIPTGIAAQQQATASYDATGWQKGLNPDAFFNTKFYLSHNPDIAAAHVNPLLHYEQYGWKEGRDPSSQFSTSRYLGANPDVKAADVDPLLHYVQHGQAEERTAFNV